MNASGASGPESMSSKIGRRVGGLGVLALLALPLGLAVAQLSHGQALVWGDKLWPGYAQVRQACAAELAVEAAAAAPVAAPTGAVAAAEKAASAAAVVATAKDEALFDDLLAEEDEAPAADAAPAEAAEAAAPATASAAAAVIAGEGGEGDAGDAGDAAAAEDDPLADEEDLLAGIDAAPTPAAPAAVAVAGPAIALSDSQRLYCKVERTLGDVNQKGVGWMPLIMAALLLFAALIATLRRDHISLRSPRTAFEDRVSNGTQLVANALILASAVASLDITSGINHTLQELWIGGMFLLICINLAQLAMPIRGEGPRDIGRAISSIPLYAWMAVISGAYFFLVEHHPAGVSIYLQKISAFSILYIQVGLYLWTGMLLRDTSLGQLLFDIVRPLRLPPELFAVVVVMLAAVPTAYSGASGILVLALGATIFTELRRAGLSQQRAMAATAMSGSLGVVLPPCLLVVIVASLNLDVTTDELFYWGWRVFGLSLLAFTAVSFAFRTVPWKAAPQAGAGGAIWVAVRRMLPYGAIGLLVVVLFDVVLDASLDEHTAPYVLPAAMLAVVTWDRLRNRRAALTGIGPVDLAGSTRATSLDTGTHIGALLMLMGLSACLGGVIERSEIIELFPHALGSPYAAMAVLMVVLVLVGMVMDPYGAVILVSVTLYPIAKDNGIHPLNFWMVALVSFELGYLTPPVALNHLLTRQVVGSTELFDEDEDDHAKGSFFQRHERVIVPAAVVLLTLLVVAFGPLLWGARA